MTTGYSERLVETLPRVRERIARAELDADREAGVVRLIAVTKSHPFAAVRAALDAGLRDLGENRVEELDTKLQIEADEVTGWIAEGRDFTFMDVRTDEERGANVLAEAEVLAAEAWMRQDNGVRGGQENLA